MLRYLAYGPRNYRERPVRPAPRERWELEGALRGRIAPLIPDRAERPRERRLWLLPPSHGHGWTGDGAESLVVALSPLRVPLAVERAAARAACTGWLLHWDMTAADADWLGGQVEALMPSYTRPDAVDLLRQERLILEVCIRALEAQPSGVVEAPDDDPRRVVETALAWFEHRLADGVSEIEVAQAIHVSPAHLRRLFHRVLSAPPRQVLGRICLQRADQFLTASDLPLDEIASACGFGSASTFCRAYLRARGHSPGRTRATKPLMNNLPQAPPSA